MKAGEPAKMPKSLCASPGSNPMPSSLTNQAVSEPTCLDPIPIVLRGFPELSFMAFPTRCAKT